MNLCQRQGRSDLEDTLLTMAAQQKDPRVVVFASYTKGRDKEVSQRSHCRLVHLLIPIAEAQVSALTPSMSLAACRAPEMPFCGFAYRHIHCSPCWASAAPMSPAWGS